MGKRGEERPLKEFFADANALDADEFEARHGVAFFTRSSVDGALDRPDKLSGEAWFTAPDPHATAAIPTRNSIEHPKAGDEFYTYPIVRRRRDDDEPLTIGRAPASDIWIHDTSVSKFHARLLQKQDGSFHIVDLGSRNGTWVGGEPLRPEEPFEVAFGKTVQFGRVRLTLMPTRQFIDFVKALQR
jgi:pSer/pThr/pTyr-binding forkhead associated (FHA) protein